MKNISVITSFSKEYYEKIGKYSVATFIKFWPANIKLYCYVENLELIPTSNIVQIPFSELPQEYYDFQKSDYKSRIKTFSKKAYSVIHAMENIDCDILIWMDADVITKEIVDYNFLTSLCDDTKLITFMGVWHHKEKNNPSSQLMFSCESSFFLLNKTHLNFKKFSKRYRQYYDERLTTNLRRFYDGEVLGATIIDMDNKNIMNDLAENLDKNPKTPMTRTILNNYFFHFKAGLKENVDQHLLNLVSNVEPIKIKS